MKNQSLVVSLLIASIALAANPAFAWAAPASPARASVPTPIPQPQLPVTPAVAPGYGAPEAQPSPPDIVGVTAQPFVGISLNDAIGMALLKNPDLAIAAANTRVASYQIAAARGAYDVRFFVEPSIKHDTVAPQNAFFSGPNFGPITQNYQNLQAGVSGQLENGAQYNVNVSQTRVDDNTIINAFNPYYLASLNVSVTQPLLRNGRFNDTRRSIQLASVNSNLTQAQTLSSVSNTISTVENTYWDLVAAWRNVAIQEAALHQSVLQQQSNARLARRGVAAPIDAVESSTQVAIYQDNVFAALQSVSTLQNELKSLIVDNPADPIWRANLVPTSSVLQIPSVPPLERLLAQALQTRPEIAQVEAARQQADINLAYAKNQTLPQVDLQLQYQGNGFAGNALPPVGGAFGSATPPPYLGGTYNQAYGNIGRFPTYSAGVVIGAPLGNHSAKANLSAANEQERIAQLQRNGIDERITFEVRNALQAYQSALSRLYAARQARAAADQVFASEQRKFRNGASTTFLVLQRQIELVQDQGRELQAQTALNKAIVELQRVDGTILTTNNVQLNTLGQGALQP